MKRSISLLIVLIMVTTLAACGGESTSVSSSSERSNSISESATGVNLSETYTNEDEGISFKYPSAWISVEKEKFNNFYTEGEIPTVLLLLANEIDEGNLSSYIEVLKFPASQSDIDNLFISDEEFASTFDDNVSIEETSIVDLDGVPARMIVYTTPNGIIYRSYFYGTGSRLYRVNFLRMQEKTGNLERFFDAIIESYKVTALTTSSSEISLPASSDGQDGFMTVTAEPSLRMRSGEGTQYDIVTEIPYGATVEIINDIDPQWFEVRYGEYVGYVLSEYLAPIGSSSMTSEEAVNIVYNIVGSGYSMEVDREEGNFYIIHVYTDNGATTSTLDWFAVDKSTGAIEASFGYFGNATNQGGIRGGQAITADEATQTVKDLVGPLYNVYYMDESDTEYRINVKFSPDLSDIAAVNKSTGAIRSVYGKINFEGMVQKEANEAAAFANLPALDCGFEWTAMPSMLNGVVEGTIRNTTNKTYSYVQITFNLYDISKNQIGSAFANINNLAGGNTWKFKATSFENDAYYFEFAEITAW